MKRARVLALTALLALPTWAALAQQPTTPAPAPTQSPTEPEPEGTPTDPAPAEPAANEAAEGSSISLIRKGKDGKERELSVLTTAPSEEVGIFVICTPKDDEPEDAPSVSVASDVREPGVRITIDKNVVTAPLAIVTKQQGGDGRIEVSAGAARFLEEVPAGKTDRLSRCLVEAAPQVKPDTVRVTQGRTNLKGSKLVYDENDGIARIDGPISFQRTADRADGNALTGSSERIEVNVDAETTTLVGKVVLKDGDRTSNAARVDYDDTANIAILRGTAEQPAETVSGGDTLRAEAIRYNLDTGEVVAVGKIGGKFQDGEATPTGTSTPATPAAPTAPQPAPAPAAP